MYIENWMELLRGPQGARLLDSRRDGSTVFVIGLLGATTSMADCSYGSSFPWTAVVGLAGIAGTLLGAYLSNKAAIKRLRIEQEHDDRTRFHRERAELYGKLLLAVQSCRRTAGDIQLLPLEKRKEYGEHGDYEPFKLVITELNTARNAVQLVSSSRVRESAEKVVIDAVVLTVGASAEEERFHTLNEKLSQSEAAFAEAARDELLPKEKADP
jgi:hypothetical protein